MGSRIRLAISLFLVLALAYAGGCTPKLVARIDFRQEGYDQHVEIEEDDTALAEGIEASLAPPNYYRWEHQHGLVLRRGRMYTKDAYMGNFKAVLKVSIVLDEAVTKLSSDGFILGIGFKQHSEETVPNFFKAVQFYGNHADLTGSIKAYTVYPHMAYATAVSIEDPAIDFVPPYVKDLMPGLAIGASLEEGMNTIVLERIGETIGITVNDTKLGDFESEYLLPGYIVSNLLFDNLNPGLPIRIGVFSACAHTDGSLDEGVFLQSLDIYADQVLHL